MPVIKIGRILFIHEDGEDGRTIIPFGHIERIFFIIIAWRMFQYKPAFVIQERGDQLWQVIYRSQRVRRTRENKIKGLFTLPDVFKNVHSDNLIILKSQLLCVLLNKGKHGGVLFHHRQILHTAGSQLIADTACASEKVEGLQRSEVEV